jgi:uncharacterized membrane protein YdjX (TVP38/TMEM64 family)
MTIVVYWTGLAGYFLDQEKLVRFLHSLGPWSFAGFVLLQIVQVIAAPIPGEMTGFLGGYLYNPVLGIVLSTIGLTAGSCIAFGLSRTFGRPLLEKLVDRKTIERFDYLLHHKGAFLVFLLFLLPGFPKDYLSYILGLGHLTMLEFLAIAASGRLLGTILLTVGGHFLRDQQYVALSLLAGFAVVVVFLCLAYRDKMERWFRTLHERHQARRSRRP